MYKIILSSILLCFLFCGCNAVQSETQNPTSKKYRIQWIPGGMLSGYAWETNVKPFFSSNGPLEITLDDGTVIVLRDNWKLEESK